MAKEGLIYGNGGRDMMIEVNLFILFISRGFRVYAFLFVLLYQ